MTGPGTRPRRGVRSLERSFPALALLTAAAFVCHEGFHWSRQAPIHTVFVVVEGCVTYAVGSLLLLRFLLAGNRRAHFSQARISVALGLFAGLAGAGQLLLPQVPAHALHLLLVQAVRLYLWASQGFRLWRWLVDRWRLGRAVSLIFGFAAVILCGAGLLLTPRATQPGSALTPVDALFTATSATCVTGLVVVDTGTAFTRFGHGIILVLMQVGGWGLILCIAWFSMAVHGRVRLRDQALLRPDSGLPGDLSLRGLLHFTVGFTLVCEALGAALLFISMEAEGAVADRLFRSVFHAVSAFCNAGFSLRSQSLIGQSGLALGTMSCLIVVGGLGFFPLAELCRAACRPRRLVTRPALSLHTRVVLWSSCLLLLGGGLSLLVLGGDHGALHAGFQSVTARTAGFHSTPVESWPRAARLVLMGLMFIGASPGSTGGGLKTSTCATLFAAASSYLRGRRDVSLLRRRLGRAAVRRASILFWAFSAGIFLCVLGLSLTDPAWRFEALLFEAVSAFGTVGLSLGGSEALSQLGRLIVIIAMFAGRIGPLTLLLALTGPDREPRVRYAPGSLLLG